MTKINFPVDATLSAYNHTVALANLSPEIILALAQHGFKQKLGDAAAMTKEEKEGFSDDAAREAHVAGRRADIVTNLLAGKFSAGGNSGPRLRGVEAVMHEIAVEVIRGAYASRGLKWPTGKGAAEIIRDLAGKYIAKNETTVRAEAIRRMEAAKAQDAVLAELLD